MDAAVPADPSACVSPARVHAGDLRALQRSAAATPVRPARGSWRAQVAGSFNMNTRSDKVGLFAIRALLVTAVAGSVLHFLLTLESPTNFVFDDAFMFTRYARHFLTAGTFSWNVADGPAYGLSSTLHLLVITALRAMTSWSDQHVVQVASTIPTIPACGVLAGIGFMVLRDGALRRAWAPLAIVPVLLLTPRVQFHSWTGMDTMLAFFCNAVLA